MHVALPVHVSLCPSSWVVCEFLFVPGSTTAMWVSTLVVSRNAVIFFSVWKKLKMLPLTKLEWVWTDVLWLPYNISFITQSKKIVFLIASLLGLLSGSFIPGEGEHCTEWWDFKSSSKSRKKSSKSRSSIGEKIPRIVTAIFRKSFFQ